MKKHNLVLAWLAPFAALIFLLFCACPIAGTGDYEVAAVPAAAQPAEPATIHMTFAGDCTFGSFNGQGGAPRFPHVYETSGSLTYPFDGVKEIFARDDLTIINFEGTLTDAGQAARKTYFFKGPAAYADILPAASVEAATLANNHSRDYLDQGFEDTVEHLSRAGIGLMYEDRPFVTKINGAEVVLIADCAVTASNSAAENAALEAVVARRVLRLIGQYKRPENIVVVNIHWGVERSAVPTAWQTKTARAWIDAGADLIVGHHPHVPQGIERYMGRYIVYSLGNFAFGGNSTAPVPHTFLLHANFSVLPGGAASYDIAVTPCYITSSRAKDGEGLLRNDYRPQAVTGHEAEGVLQMLRERSAMIPGGIKELRLQG
ncbi:MAG: CapA family protein [Oscillospiraceae bacterium]|jgi:poly-gamma-glutamate synthesis protein (capsule biosynthesis protein)|nr:CapA family protein [Oscillospiraceae bacterium]